MEMKKFVGYTIKASIIFVIIMVGAHYYDVLHSNKRDIKIMEQHYYTAIDKEQEDRKKIEYKRCLNRLYLMMQHINVLDGTTFSRTSKETAKRDLKRKIELYLDAVKKYEEKWNEKFIPPDQENIKKAVYIINEVKQ